jgi:flagellin
MDGINRAADRISSGERIDYQNNAAEAAIAGRQDTAAGEATIGIRNATSQISSLQTADQNLARASELIERAQAFSVQAGNGALSDSDRDIIESQSQALVNEAAGTLENATFNGNRLFGEGSGIDIEGLQEKLDIIRESGASLDPEALASVQESISLERADVGARQNAVVSKEEQLDRELIASKSSRSALADTDYAKEMTDLIKEELIFKASVEVFNHRRLAEESIINLLTG